MDIIRTLRLDTIQIPVSVNHEHMVLLEDEKGDDPLKRLDILNIEITLRYRGGAMDSASHTGAFDFSTLEALLLPEPVRQLTGPTEMILDEILERIESIAASSDLALVQASVISNRRGLVLGMPELKRLRHYGAVAQLPVGSFRSAGIARVPLRVRVDHSWRRGSESGTIQLPTAETVELNFAALTPAQPLQHSLTGLYNYFRTYNLAGTLHNTLVDGPFERLAEDILHRVWEDCSRLDPVMLEASITRAGVTRCRPTMGVQLWR